jgi:hypothetical protein
VSALRVVFLTSTGSGDIGLPLIPLFCTDFLEERTLTGVVDNVKLVRGGKRKRSVSASDVEPTMKPQTPVKSPAAKRTRGKAPVKTTSPKKIATPKKSPLKETRGRDGKIVTKKVNTLF